MVIMANNEILALKIIVVMVILFVIFTALVIPGILLFDKNFKGKKTFKNKKVIISIVLLSIAAVSFLLAIILPFALKLI